MAAGNDEHEERRDDSGFCLAGEINPWENRGQLGSLRGFGLTVKNVLFNTDDFFAGIPVAADYRAPVLFLALTVLVGFLATLFLWEVKWRLLGSNEFFFLSARQSVWAGLKTGDKVLGAVALKGLLSVLLQGAACALALRTLRLDRRGFSATISAYCYAGAVETLRAVPLIGAAAASLYGPIVLSVGLARMHRTGIHVGVIGALAAFSGDMFVRFLLP